jgi:hypothetical protein
MDYDVYYILSLSDSNIPALIDLKKVVKDDFVQHNYSCILNSKIENFKKVHAKKSWKSWNYLDAKVSEVIEINTTNKRTTNH